MKGLRNLRNHIDTDPTAKIIVVTHAEGVDLVMEGAKSANGTEYAPLVSALKSRGVSFEIFLPVGYRQADGDWLVTLKKIRRPREQFVTELR